MDLGGFFAGVLRVYGLLSAGQSIVGALSWLFRLLFYGACIISGCCSRFGLVFVRGKPLPLVSRSAGTKAQLGLLELTQPARRATRRSTFGRHCRAAAVRQGSPSLACCCLDLAVVVALSRLAPALAGCVTERSKQAIHSRVAWALSRFV